MSGRGSLYIEYSHDRKGNKLEKPFFHDLKTITVHDNPKQQHAMAYHFDDGREIQIFFHHDRMEIIAKGEDCLEIYQLPSDEKSS